MGDIDSPVGNNKNVYIRKWLNARKKPPIYLFLRLVPLKLAWVESEEEVVAEVGTKLIWK